MADKIKGITIELNADTKSFNKALKSVSDESKKTQSELKAVNGALKLDPKNLDLIKQKQDLLTKATSESKDALSALKSAKEKADADMANGTEVNQEQYRKLQREITFAEDKVKSIEKETKNFTEEIKKTSKEIDVFGDKTEKLNKAADTMGKTALAAGTAIVGSAISAAYSADEINTLAKTTGLSTEEIQKFQYASERIDVSLDTLTGSMSKLTKNMATATSGTGDAYDAFKELGIEFVNQDGTLRDKQEVFSELIAKLGEMENETQRDAYAMQLMGKSAQDLNPLILGGSEALTAYGEEAEAAGLILSQESLDGANAFADGIDKLKATVAAGVGKMGGAFAEKLVPAIEKVIKVVEKVINFITKHKTVIMTLVAVLGTLAAGIKAVTIVQAALNTVLNANPIGLVIAAVAALVAGFIYLWENCEGFREFWIGLWENIVEIATGVGEFFATLFTETIPAVFQGFLEFFGNIFSTDFSEKFGALGNIINGFMEGVKGVFEPIKEVFTNIIDLVKNVFTGSWSEAWENVKEIFGGVFDALVGIAKAPLNLIIGIINGLIGGINLLIGGLNKISFTIPDWVPELGGKSIGFNIPDVPTIPYLAKGGILTSGQAIVAEAGPELITMINGKTIVQPLTGSSKNTPVGGDGGKNIKIEQTFTSPKALTPFETARLNKNALTTALMGVR